MKIDYDKIAKRISESRSIVKEIENFGVKESQKIDIMYYLAMTLEDNELMKKITSFLKEFKENISENVKKDSTQKQKNKIIL